MSVRLDPVFPIEGKKVWVAGHRGMLGQALVRRLTREKCEVLTVARADLDLDVQADVEAWTAAHRPEVIFVAAGTVGGIVANQSAPWTFLRDNLSIALHVIDAARKVMVPRVVYIASSCMYPKDGLQPLTEDQLLTGPLEPTNQGYALAKIAGVMMTQSLRMQDGLDYISVIPTNLYGPGDNFDLRNSHVLAALLRRIHEAKINSSPRVTVWGSGDPIREFLHVDDCADACVYLASMYSDDYPINIGSGEEISIADLAKRIAHIVGYRGTFEYDRSLPDGVFRKALDLTRIRRLGWKHKIPLDEGIRSTYEWYTSVVDAD